MTIQFTNEAEMSSHKAGLRSAADVAAGVKRWYAHGPYASVGAACTYANAAPAQGSGEFLISTRANGTVGVALLV
jgi:hypothetical protein